MRIIFICGSAEPGKDGVGDYTRRLCGKLIVLKHEVQVIAICDHHAISFSSDEQLVEGTMVVVNRIPISNTNHQRLIYLQNIVSNYQPDWISLQYVPYSYNSRGLPFWLPSFLKKLKGNHQWHIMFHELWIGIDQESSLKTKIIGRIQQLLIKKVVSQTNAQLITTQNQLYKNHLKFLGYEVELLPIFSNISNSTVAKDKLNRIQFVLFGTIHHGATFESFIEDVKKWANHEGKSIHFVFIGKNGSELENYETLLKSSKISYEVLGIRSEEYISQILIDSDYGLSTTPYFQTEKSGVYAAYSEHLITTISLGRPWTPSKGQYVIPQVIKYTKGQLELIPVAVTSYSLELVADKFINYIESI
ncbi:hypothetical protein FFWV33_12095 [Flavobacterium faecale]|uniref:Glycosyl transferase family 1 domain-containing protein n=1 Tax=Flavobacterium faecale TaxID=1355330 RepID=A0A2S1LEJ7_9FLAO|nr:hypothetical protein [Flavobacterium faecale]AWG22202.1 hypothetical protein FFWV33_12095 [Flavobacterium faecale]